VSTVSTFFEELNRLGYNPEMREVRGTVRFEIRDADRVEHWFLTIDDGRVWATPGWREAQAVLKTDTSLAEEATRGRVNALAAMLRSDIVVEGDLSLALKLGRLFPASADTQGPQRRTRPTAGR